MKVKICGITSLVDAAAAVEAGADMLGFNFYPGSARYIDREHCHQIIRALQTENRRTLHIGVFVNAAVDEIQDSLAFCELDLAQLSGDEDPGVLKILGAQAFKGVRPQTRAHARAALRQLPKRSLPPALLVDAYRQGEYGGTGQTGDWRLAATLAHQQDILLAGGLTPDNVGAAIEQVQPWGVDVASGVERQPGIKDHKAVERFIRNAHAADKEKA